MDGRPFTLIECSDFSLYKRFLDNEEIDPIVAQRQAIGFNWLRVWLLNQSVIGGRNGGFDGSRIHPADYASFYDQLDPFADLCGRFGLGVDFTVFTSTGTLMPNRDDQQRHLDATADAVRGKGNVILSLVNEGDQYDNAPHPDLTRPAGVIITRGSNGADGTPPRHDEPWDAEEYHSNDLSEWWRKVGHNAGEWQDQSGTPCWSSENTRPDRDGNAQHHFDAAMGAALLCAGSCAHSNGGKFSTLLTGVDLDCAHAWVAGAKSIPLEFCRGSYIRRDDLNSETVIRAYEKRLPDGRSYVIKIRS